MKRILTYENKKVLVLGLAKSGVSVAKPLHESDTPVIVNDGKSFDENPEAQELSPLGIEVITGSHSIKLLDEELSLMAKNPGISYSYPLVTKAQEMGIPVITEVELAYEVAEYPIIGITGTNGKTTTTTMTGLPLNAGVDKGAARLTGNIGYPASGIAQEAKPENKIVMELSSFQLMGATDFHPRIAVIVNIYEAHIDYRGTKRGYVKAKQNPQKNTTAEDYLVLNWDQSELQELTQRTKARVLPFSTKEVLEDGVYADDHVIYYKKGKIMEISELSVPGARNVGNVLAAITVAKLYGVSNEAIRQTLYLFHGALHRTQYVGEIQGRKFYNDSKATNISATKMALSGFETARVALLVGGLDRGNIFDELVPSLKGIKAVIVFGQAKEKLIDAGEKAGTETIVTADSVEQAVFLALESSTDGDVILLSPTNTSWNQYPNFETRGNRFMEAVN